MQGSKLIELIQTLSQEEIKAFGSFLEGESYRKTSAIFELYQYLKKYHPIFPEKKITKELVYKKIMPAGKAYNNKRMRDMMSILSLNLEHFLLKKELEENEIEKEFLMLNILKKRNLDKLYFQKIKQLQKKWEKNRPNGIEQYYNEYRLLHHLYYHPNVSVYSEMEIALGDLIGKLDQYYFASKLYETIGHIRTQRMISYSKDKTSNVLIEEILENSNHHVFEENLYVNLYSKLLYAFNTGDYSNYADLKDLFFNNIEDFSEDEKKKNLY